MLYFIRHGQVDANLRRIFAGGELDIPLNETGIRQAEKFREDNREFIESVDKVYVSPMKRTCQTAEIIFEDDGPTIEVVENLREWLLGQWSGKPYDVANDLFLNKPDPPGGETWKNFQERTLRALYHVSSQQDKKAMIVAHGGVWYSYAERFSHELTHIENCAYQEMCRLKLGGLKFS